MDENRLLLLEHFARSLLALEPDSVLDVGCGGGDLLQRCIAAGVSAEGLEPDPASVEACRARGLAVRAGDATDLPFGDGSFGWVALRHVPHHVEHPRAALAEAWRVARKGLIVAEPWFDEGLESQRLGLRVDRLWKRFERARGVFHGDLLGAGEWLAGLPEGEGAVEVETFLRLRALGVEDYARECGRALGGMEAGEEEMERAFLERRVAAGEVTLNGTVIVRVGKDEGWGVGGR